MRSSRGWTYTSVRKKEGEILTLQANMNRMSSLLKTWTERFITSLNKVKAKQKEKDAFALELKEKSNKNVAAEKVE